MKVLNNSVMSIRFIASSMVYVVLLFVFLISTPALAGGKRFNAPSLIAPLDDFNKRLDSGSFNVDFLVAQTLNLARRLEREGDRFKRNAELFRSSNIASNTNVASNGNVSSNSVIIPPGTKADTIIVINQNDGDSYAISR